MNENTMKDFVQNGAMTTIAKELNKLRRKTNDIESTNNVGGKYYVRIVTTTDTLTSLDDVIVCNSTTAFTVTLPTASGSGKVYIIKNINTGSITVSKAGDTIDGETTQTLGQWDSIQIVDVSANVWAIV